MSRHAVKPRTAHTALLSPPLSPGITCKAPAISARNPVLSPNYAHKTRGFSSLISAEFRLLDPALDVGRDLDQLEAGHLVAFWNYAEPSGGSKGTVKCRFTLGKVSPGPCDLCSERCEAVGFCLFLNCGL
eukprot:2075774-Rhodomonas_salina.2